MKMNVPSNTGSPSLHQDSSSDLVNKLTAAIQAGDEEKTEALVKQLCNLKVKLNISLEQEEQEERFKENDFSVKVHIEDRVSKGCLIPLKVKACDTIGDLKKKMMLNYDFPPDVQRWIIGKKIPKDQDRLSQCGVKGPGHTLYLYLVTARSVGITREDYVYQKQNMLEGNNSNMTGLTAAAVSIPCQGPAEMAEVPSPIQEPMQGNISSGFGSSFAMAPLFRSGSPVAQDVMARPEPNRQMSKQSVSSGSNRLQTMLESPTLSMNSGPLPVNPQFDQGEGIAPVSPAGSTRSFSPAEIHSNSASTRRKSWTASVSPQAEPAPTQVGWACASCTYINLPARPGCEMCANTRPLDYQIPVDYVLTPEEIVLLEAEKRAEQTTRERVQENYQELMAVADLDLIPNPEPFSCPICFDDVEKGEGILLRECLHMFCKDCLQDAVRLSEEAYLKCPYQDNFYSCQAMLQEREIKALVTEEVFIKYLQRGLDQAEASAANSYHCKTADCHGWCLYDDLINFFLCPVCGKENCLTCKAIHEGMNCKEYQKDLEIRANNDKSAKQTKEMLDRLVASKEAMHCPQCNVVVQKKGGCDWIKCSICKLEICWVTQKPRWGPKGEGDTSGGCGCRVNGKKCHPACMNCH